MAIVAESVESKAEYLLPGSMAKNVVPDWPPDLFCLCAAILQASGAYSRVIDDVDSKYKVESSKQRARRLRRAGLSWKDMFSTGKQPRSVMQLWNQIYLGRLTILSELGSDDASTVRNALLELLAISDEACAGLGIQYLDPQLRQQGGLETFGYEAESLFVKSMSKVGGGATLC